MPCTRALPSAVASTGPCTTGTPVRSASAWRYSAERPPPPNTATSVTSPNRSSTPAGPRLDRDPQCRRHLRQHVRWVEEAPVGHVQQRDVAGPCGRRRHEVADGRGAPRPPAAPDKPPPRAGSEE